MAYYATETELPIEVVLRRAAAFFGPQGVGLEVARHSLHHLFLTGERGHISVMAGMGRTGTAVDVETRAWDPQVRDFLCQIAR
jgi:hypothetical protein